MTKTAVLNFEREFIALWLERYSTILGGKRSGVRALAVATLLKSPLTNQTFVPAGYWGGLAHYV